MEFLSPEPELPLIRCITCNKILADKFERYEKLINQGYSIEQALNTLGLIRPCCRLRMRNPFKVIVEKIEESDFEKLSISNNPDAPVTGSLSLLNTSSILIEEETEIMLKPIQELPTFPKTKTEEKTQRIYQAW